MLERREYAAYLVDGQGERRVLLLEHQVQRVEERPGDVPVEVVGLQVERVRVGQQVGQTVGDRLPVVLGDADVDVAALERHVRLLDPMPFSSTCSNAGHPSGCSPASG
jgi:hypothetical protein